MADFLALPIVSVMFIDGLLYFVIFLNTQFTIAVVERMMKVTINITMISFMYRLLMLWRGLITLKTLRAAIS